MQNNYRRWLATLALGILGTAGATAAQAQVRINPYLNISVGGPLTEGVYGRIQFGSDVAIPPLYASTPVRVRRPVAYSQPVYLYVPHQHRQNWGKYCSRYGACDQSVYFVNPRAMRQQVIHRQRSHHPKAVAQQRYHPAQRHAVVQQRHDNGRHSGWSKNDRHPESAWNHRYISRR